jgi:hypothetical protein
VTAAPFPDLLQPGETLLWQGRIGFNLTSSPVLTAVLLILTAYTAASLWFIQSEAQFCAAAPGQAGCGLIYRLMPPLALILTGFQTFDMLERRALMAGRAQGAILLTDRRLIRASTWPRARVRSFDYRATPARRGIGGVIRFGTLKSSVILAPEDAATVRDLMRNPGKGIA